MCGNKNREAFPSEQYCGLKIYEKFNLYEICNKYNENTFAIYIFFNISITYYDLFAPTIQHTCIPYGPEHSLI